MVKTKDRIKAVRKSLGLTQQEFGDKIGLKKNSLSQLETGRNNITNSVILSICREFKVNEVWLRTGLGEMFAKISEDDRFSLALGALGVTDNRLARNMLIAIAEASPEKLKHIEEFMKECLGLE